MISWVLKRETPISLRTEHDHDFFLGNRRDLFYWNFESWYILNGLTDWLDFLHGTIIWPCLLMNEVTRNFRQCNHPNQPTYPKTSNQRSQKNIPWNFLKFCINNHPSLGQILGKLYGDHVITLAVIAKSIFSRYQKQEIHGSFFRCLCISTCWHRKYPRMICQVITCLC